ncbi:MAG: LVIVD repeat-containing protein [Terriglobales bacterium]
MRTLLRSLRQAGLRPLWIGLIGVGLCLAVQAQLPSLGVPQACTPAQLAAIANGTAPPLARGQVACHRPDPREGLKAGRYDAGQASENMTLVASLHQPAGMFDPKANPRSLDYANSDLAFGKNGTLAIQGNFHGLIFYNISDPEHPKLETILSCPGGQGDISIWGNLAFMSVETDGRINCSNPPPRPPRPAFNPATMTPAQMAAMRASFRRTPPPDPDRARGVRIFDISNPLRPRSVAMVQTCRGSHTHTIVTDPNDPNNIYIYVSGTAGVRSPKEMAGCDNGGPNDPHTSNYGIDIIKVPLAHPAQARVIKHAYIFTDANTGAIDGLHGRTQGTGVREARATIGCHDITAYPWKGVAGGACAGNGLLLNITNPADPVRIDDVADPAFSFWHSATFNNAGTTVLFSDEWGGGTQPRCRPQDPPNWGGDATFTIVGRGAGRHLRFQGYYKMPAWQTSTENCVAHNGSLVPVPGRDIMSQAFYQGGATVFDFTNPAHVQEIAYFDRGPISATQLIIGGYWSIYYYKGYLYGSEIARGFDVFKLEPSKYLTQNEIDAAALAQWNDGVPGDLNVQDQPHFTWPAVYVVARAYLDQLNRDHAVPADQIAALNQAMTQVDGMSAGSERAAAVSKLDAMARQLQDDAAQAPRDQPRDASRMRSAAATILAHDRTLR